MIRELERTRERPRLDDKAIMTTRFFFCKCRESSSCKHESVVRTLIRNVMWTVMLSMAKMAN
jgi:hypothetical protein